ncbi:MAG: sulfite exporter TauE/SafE family protein [Glaciimonas sp.]|nr:sulfite exporter TauE/SafE family protein [Glaciimonas sp.]
MITSIGLGLLIGTVMALTGAGGGILAVPLLVFFAHLDVAQAGPIGLLAVGLAAALGASFGLKTRTLRYRAALLIAGAGMLLSPVGFWLAQRLDNRSLGILFGFILLFVAFRTYRQAQKRMRGQDPAPTLDLPCVRDAASGRFIWTTKCARALALSGTIAGLLSGLLGVGGGFVMVPALQRYTDLTMQSVVETSLAVIALISLAGVATSASAGHLNFAIAIPFSGGALAGVIAGRNIASRLAGPQLQKGFALICVVVAAGMMAKALA